MAKMEVVFPGGKKVDALFKGFAIKTDQPVSGGGEGSAPSPYDLFLASLGTCAGIFVLGFLQSRKLSAEGLKIEMDMNWDDKAHLMTAINMDIKLPPGFPDQYRDAVIKAAELCLVKRQLKDPPAFSIKTS